MKFASVALLVTGMVFAGNAHAAAADLVGPQELILPDVRAAISNASRTYDAKSVAPLAEVRFAPARSQLTLRHTEAAVGLVKIRPELLKQAVAPGGSAAAFAGRAPLPRRDRILALNVASEQLVLRLTSVVYDARYDLYHSSAVVLNRDDGYARFTADASGNVAGTLYLPSGSYRIVPDSSGAQQIVRVGVRPASAAASPVAFDSQLTAPALQRLERRHAQAQIVAELQPRVFMLAQSNLNVYLEGAELAHVSLEVFDENALRAALITLAPLTNARADTDLRIVLDRKRADGSRLIQFEQLIHGVPLNRRNEVTVDSSGKITKIDTSLLTQQVQVAEPLIAERQALDIALRAVATHHGSPSEFRLSKPPVLRYEFAVGGGKVEPIYRFALQASPSSSYEVRVNASSGEPEVVSGSVRAESIEIFRATSGAPDSGSAPGAQQVWSAFVPGVGSTCMAGSAVCMNYIPPRVAHNWSYYWNVQAWNWNEAACCENLNIDIVVDTAASANGGEYRSGTNSILFPASGDGAHGANPDGVLHELGHAYIDQYNVPGNVGSDHVSLAIREGIADAVAATYPAFEEEQIGWRDYDYGNDWIIFDGQGPYSTSVRRDLRTPRQWSYMTTQSDYHAAGMAVGNFFYRLKLGNFDGNAGMVQFAQRVAYALQDVEGDGRIDLLDFKRATYVAVNNDPPSIAFINSTWEAMSAQQIPGGQVPAPPGAPAAPSSVLSLPTGCVSGFSTYSVSWNAPANTTYYVTYVKLPNSLLYAVSDRIDAPQNWGYGYTNYNTDARIAACNSAGCSLMSAMAAGMPHNQCGF